MHFDTLTNCQQCQDATYFVLRKGMSFCYEYQKGMSFCYEYQKGMSFCYEYQNFIPKSRSKTSWVGA